jgi:hypothetical protein
MSASPRPGGNGPKSTGYLVTLKEKARHTPNVHRLMGAADIWAGNNATFPPSAKSYGINKLLINGQCAPEHMQKMVDLGYLPGKYDIYTDVYNDKPEDQIDALSAPIPGHIVQKEMAKDGRLDTL